MTDEPPTPLKPQDTIILLLGELKGSVSSLQASVESNNRAQAAINAQNELEHAKFRDEISTLTTDVAVLKDSRTSQRYTASERTQKWMTWIAAPSALVALIGFLFQIINK